MKQKCWVAVDKDGTEKISNSVFVRRLYIKSILWGSVKVNYSKNARKKWANCWSSNETNALPFCGVEIPKGSIEKLIGKKLTWNDEPFELDYPTKNSNEIPTCLYNPWPTKDVLEKLIWATEYLLHDKSYDGHNHEELQICVNRGNEILNQLK